MSVQALLMWWFILPLGLASLVGSLRFRRFPSELRWVVGLTWWMLLVEAASRVLWAAHLPNLLLKPVFALGECALLVAAYRQALRPAPARPLYWLLGAFTAYALWDLTGLRTSSLFYPQPEVLEMGILLYLALRYLRKLLNELVVEHLHRDPVFWVSGGLVFYALGNLLIALVSNYLLRYSQTLNLTIWAIHAVLLGVLASCYSAAFYVYRSPTTPTAKLR